MRLILSFSLTRMTAKPQNGRGNALRLRFIRTTKRRTTETAQRWIVVRSKDKNAHYFVATAIIFAIVNWKLLLFTSIILFSTKDFFLDATTRFTFRNFRLTVPGKPSFVLLLVWRIDVTRLCFNPFSQEKGPYRVVNDFKNLSNSI